MDDEIFKKVIEDLIREGVIRLYHPKLSRYVLYLILNADRSVIEEIAKKYDISPEQIYSMTTSKIARILGELENITKIKMSNGYRYMINDLNDRNK
jgi:fructose 1,6-bisphosphatase